MRVDQVLIHEKGDEGGNEMLVILVLVRMVLTGGLDTAVRGVGYHARVGTAIDPDQQLAGNQFGQTLFMLFALDECI